MKLSAAPTDMREAADKLAVAFKMIGIDYSEMFKSFNSRKNVIRVKFWMIRNLDKKQHAEMRRLGFHIEKGERAPYIVSALATVGEGGLVTPAADDITPEPVRPGSQPAANIPKAALAKPKKIPFLHKFLLQGEALSCALRVANARWPGKSLGYVGTDEKTFQHYFQEWGNHEPFILG